MAIFPRNGRDQRLLKLPSNALNSRPSTGSQVAVPIGTLGLFHSILTETYLDLPLVSDQWRIPRGQYIHNPSLASSPKAELGHQLPVLHRHWRTHARQYYRAECAEHRMSLPTPIGPRRRDRAAVLTFKD